MTPNDPIAVETRRIVADVARSISQRAEAQGWKGKKADGLAIECACGALAAAIAIHGEDGHPTVNGLSFFAFMVGTRGFAYVKDRIEQHNDEKSTAAAHAFADALTKEA